MGDGCLAEGLFDVFLFLYLFFFVFSEIDIKQARKLRKVGSGGRGVE